MFNYKLVVSFVNLCMMFSLCCFGQELVDTDQTPESYAQRLTGRMVRELNITDSVQCDTLYRMHLKYARLRATISNKDEKQALIPLFESELKQILSAQQYNLFTAKMRTRRQNPISCKMTRQQAVTIPHDTISNTSTEQ